MTYRLAECERVRGLELESVAVQAVRDLLGLSVFTLELDINLERFVRLVLHTLEHGR